jgi:Dirigent-like protein
MSSKLRTISLVALGAIVLALAGVAAGFASGSNVRVVHIMTARPHIETLDFPPKGKSPGDVYVFDATIISPSSQRVIGRLRGTQTDIKIEHGMETVQGMLTYQFGDGSEIVIGGLAAYPLTGKNLVKGQTFVRPVLGGTGRFAGASGVLYSRRLSGNRYDQVFKLTF